MSENITICTKCRFFFNLEPTGPRTNIWYNHFCKAKPLPTAIDPYNGKRKPYGTNDLGGKYYVDEEQERGEKYSYCRDINKGDCEYFEETQ